MTPRSGAIAAATALRCLAAICIAAVFTGCAGTPVVGNTADLSQIKKIVMMPVQNMAAIYGPSRNVRNPLSGSVFITGDVSPEAAQLFESAVYARITALERFEVLPPESALGIMSSLTSRDAAPIIDRSLWIESGRALNADGVLVCFIYRYRERVGSRYASEEPASVAFDLTLLRTVDGRIMWTGRFDETQRALSENLLEINKFMKRKGWISAADLAAAGLDDLFSAMSAPRPATGAAENDP
ncbi:MAG: hypothetical protein ABIL58_00175 [Pseudomonadota bacterium]